MNAKWTLAACTLGASMMCAAPAAMAQDVELYAWPDSEVVAMVATRGGLIFMHKDGSPYRVYSWTPEKRASQEPYFVTDFDGDGQPEVLGAGRPTFMIDTNADPLWSNKGCAITNVGDFSADRNPDVMCSDRRKIKMLTYDNQLIWDLTIGPSFKRCTAGDTNGDLKADLECTITGNRMAIIDGEGGSVIDPNASDSQIANPDAEVWTKAALADPGVIGGSTLSDLNGDGTAEEYLTIDDTLVSVVSKSNPKALVTADLKAKPEAAMFKDLDGDGFDDVIVVSKKAIVTFFPKAEKVKSRTFSTSTKTYKRKPVADLQNVFANNFEDNDAAVAAFEAMGDKLSKCYAGQVKKNKFAGSGKLLLQAFVDEKGKVKTVNKLHSEIPDKKVASCAMTTLKKTKAPKAAEGNQGMINITINYTFRDQ